MKTEELIAISDFNEMAVLDYARVFPENTERIDRRYTGFYSKKKAEPVLTKYRSGELKVIARDFVSSLRLIKDQIFNDKRLSGDQYERAAHR